MHCHKCFKSLISYTLSFENILRISRFVMTTNYWVIAFVFTREESPDSKEQRTT